MNARILVGGLLVVLGLAWLSSLAGWWDAWAALGVWWPSLLVLVGLLAIANAPRSPAGGLFLLAIGGVLQAWRLGVFPRWSWTLIGPVALILVGLMMLLTRERSHARGEWRGPTGGGKEESDAERIERDVLFGGTELRETSRDFRGGRVSATFAGAKVDLRSATIAPAGATLEVHALFGGIELAVPAEWEVRVKGSTVFGAFEDRTSHAAPAPGAKPLLDVKGSATFGGVTVRN